MTEQTEGRYLTAREVAKRLNIGVSTLYRMIKRGMFLQGGFFGGSRRWNVSDVDRWAAQTLGGKA